MVGADEFIKRLSQKQPSRYAMSNSPEKTVRVSLYHLLDLFIGLKCPKCGHEHMVTESDMRVVKGVSYVKKDEFVPKAKAPEFKVDVGDEVEL